MTKLVQITLNGPAVDLRLRRLLCGKAEPFRGDWVQANLLRLGWKAEPSSRGGGKKCAEPVRKAGGFPHSRRQSRTDNSTVSLIWTAVVYDHRHCQVIIFGAPRLAGQAPSAATASCTATYISPPRARQPHPQIAQLARNRSWELAVGDS